MMQTGNIPPTSGVPSARTGLLVWLQRWGITALGVLLAAFTSFGSIDFKSGGALLLAALIISFLNVFLRPLLVLFTLPFVILTLGFGMLLINAVLFKLTAALVDGFIVKSWWAAIWGGVVVSVVSVLVNGVLFGSRIQVRRYGPGGRGIPPADAPRSDRIRRKDDDVIDV